MSQQSTAVVGELAVGSTRVRFHPLDGNDQVYREIDSGVFERPLPELICECARALGGTFVDIGANSGIYTLLALASNRHGLRCHAFEPYPVALAALKANIEANSMQDRVVVHEIALSDSNGVATLFLPPPSGAILETSASLNPVFKDHAVPSQQVVTKKFDDAIPAGELVTVIKVDIEGHEDKFLTGAMDRVARDRPYIFIEVLQHANVDVANLFIRRFDFVNYELHTDGLLKMAEVRFNIRAWNHAFIPSERAPEFERIAAAAGVPTIAEPR